MIQLLNTENDGLDVTITISKNLNFLLYIYRFYDFRDTNPTAFEHIVCDEQGLMSTAFFHLRAITLWNNIIYALGEANKPIEADEVNWYEEQYDFDALFKDVSAYQAVRNGFHKWWESEGETSLLTLEKQIETMLQDFPLKNLDQSHFLILPLYDTYPESLTWNNEYLVTMTPQDITDPSKVLQHLTFMSKA